MRLKFDHDFHIHSMISTCSGDPEQTPQAMLEYAKRFGLKKIIITDHYWDESVPGANAWYAPQDTEYLKHWLPLPKCDGVEFLYGCEIDMDKHYTLGISKARMANFDFIIIPTTHMHTNWTVPDEAIYDNKKRMQVWIDRLDAVLDMDLPFHKIGIAHLTCGLLALNRADYVEVLDMLPESELARLFTKAAERGCGIELNACDMNYREGEQETVMRIYRIAKRCGCKFYFGSDAHHPKDFDITERVFNRAIDLLGLTEEDRFVPTR